MVFFKAKNGIPALTIMAAMYNEEKNVELFVERAVQTLKSLTDFGELLILSDGSTDKTPEILKKMEKKYNWLRVIYRKENKGIGPSLKELYENVTGEIVFDTPADNQQDPRDLNFILPELNDSVDILTCYRKQRADAGYRHALATIYSTILRILYGIKLKDIDCSRVYRRKVLKDIRIEYTSSFMINELFAKALRKGYKFKEVGINHYPRTYGKNKGASFRIASRQLRDALFYWPKFVLGK